MWYSVLYRTVPCMNVSFNWRILCRKFLPLHTYAMTSRDNCHKKILCLPVCDIVTWYMWKSREIHSRWHVRNMLDFKKPNKIQCRKCLLLKKCYLSLGIRTRNDACVLAISLRRRGNHLRNEFFLFLCVRAAHPSKPDQINASLQYNIWPNSMVLPRNSQVLVAMKRFLIWASNSNASDIIYLGGSLSAIGFPPYFIVSWYVLQAPAGSFQLENEQERYIHCTVDVEGLL